MSNKKFLTSFKDFINKKKDKSYKYENQRSLKAKAYDEDQESAGREKLSKKNNRFDGESKSGFDKIKKCCLESVISMYGGVEPLVAALEFIEESTKDKSDSRTLNQNRLVKNAGKNDGNYLQYNSEPR